MNVQETFEEQNNIEKPYDYFFERIEKTVDLKSTALFLYFSSNIFYISSPSNHLPLLSLMNP